MTDTPLPSLPLPPPMTGAPPDSWARDTIERRWPDILRRMLADNDFPIAVQDHVLALAAEIPNGLIAAIADPGAPDVVDWNRWIRPYAGMDWLTPPWFFCEHYFYRRVMAIIGYFQAGDGEGRDPFIHQKQQGLTMRRDAVSAIARSVESAATRPADAATLKRLLHLDLWGNQADLSLWPADGEEKPDHDTPDGANAFLLADDTDTVVDYLLEISKAAPRIDILVDNAGMELAVDLVLTDYLLTTGLAAAVRLHLKPHPTFVSDAMIKDVEATVRFLEQDDAKAMKTTGARLKGHARARRLQLTDHPCWTSPLPAWEMPAEVRQPLSQSGLVISKGDAHYRRLLGDRGWRYTDRFQDVVSFFPAPLLALRTLKSELACGLAPGQAEGAAAADPSWRTDGRWGVAQFAK